MKTVNRRVAVEPFEKTSATVTMTKHVAMIKQKSSLAKLRVVLPTSDGDFDVGDHVFVHGEFSKNQLAAQVLEAEGSGQKFILVPYDMIVAVERAGGR